MSGSGGITNIASFIANLQMPANANPVMVKLPPPPKLEGPLAINNVLSSTVKFAENIVDGPDSMVIHPSVGSPNRKPYIYTTLENGRVVEISPEGNMRSILQMSIPTCGQPGAEEGACGRPLGIEVDSQSYLVVADAYGGLYKINPQNGLQHEGLAQTRTTPVNGKRMGFVNDLAIANDRKIYFSSASSKWSRKNYHKIILEGETSGRILEYDPSLPMGQQVRELVNNINFPTGLELSADGNVLYFAEAARSRIYKAYIKPGHPKYKQIELLSENLPGIVSKITRTARGTLWVAFSHIRHAGFPGPLDLYGDQPNIRGLLMGAPYADLYAYVPKHALACEYSAEGKALRCIHDPTGAMFDAISEVKEVNGTLYIAAPNRKYIGILDGSQLPPVNTQLNDPVTPVNTISNAQIQAFLDQVREKMNYMSPIRVKDVVVLLAQKLVEMRIESYLRDQLLQKLAQEVQALRNTLSTTASPGSSTTATTATTAIPTTRGTTAPGATTAAPTSTTSSGATTTTKTAWSTVAAVAGSTVSAAQSTTAGTGTTTAAPSTTAGTTATTAAPSTTAGTGATTSGTGATMAASSTTAGTGATTTAPSGTTSAATITTDPRPPVLFTTGP